MCCRTVELCLPSKPGRSDLNWFCLPSPSGSTGPPGEQPGAAPLCVGMFSCETEPAVTTHSVSLCLSVRTRHTSAKISCEVSSDEPQLYQSWEQLEMASVLSGWYLGSYNGYNIHNIFNVANFIEYEQHPKRRKLDSSNNYLTSEILSGDYETSTTVRARKGVSYRPYSDLSQQSPGVKQKQNRNKTASKTEAVVKTRAQCEETPREGTTIDVLFPEILCLIFEKLDLQSKGRAAQVNYIYYY